MNLAGIIMQPCACCWPGMLLLLVLLLLCWHVHRAIALSSSLAHGWLCLFGACLRSI